MSVEFQGKIIPNLRSVILKPSFSWGVLVSTSSPSNEAAKEEWNDNVDLLLQYGVDVLVSDGKLKSTKVQGYNLVYTPQEFDTKSLREFLSVNNIRVLDGSTR